jgi:hypothetical protein
MLIGNSTTILTDVSITHPCAPTFVRKAAQEQRYAAKEREKIKCRAYDPLAEREKCRFVPWVMEAPGALGWKCYDLIEALCAEKARSTHRREGFRASPRFAACRKPTRITPVEAVL